MRRSCMIGVLYLSEQTEVTMNTSKAKSIMHFPFFGIFLIITEIVTQELTLCPLPRINSKCVLTCKTPNLKKTVSFIEQGNILGSCEIIGNNNICEPFNNNFLISQNKSASETYLTIMSTNENDGSWHCEYGKRQSQSKKLQLYDIMYHTSLVNIPIVHETGNLISINFQTDCLMPEPTSSLHCKNGEEMCKVSPFKKRKCEKSGLRIYNVTCYTTSECHLETESKVEIKVYDYIIDQKIITHGNEQKQITVDNENGTSSHDGIPTMLLPIIVILLVSLLL